MNGPATVLVVEDEFAIAALLEMVLTDAGYRVVLANNGRQGIECLTEGPRPNLVISDYMMPVLDGVGMLKAMRESETLRDIPCIFMSAMPEASVRAHVTDFVAFFRKPFDIYELVSLIKTVVDAQSATIK